MRTGRIAPAKTSAFSRILKRTKLKQNWQLHLLLLAPVIMLGIFEYVPMVGLSIAFQQFYPTKGFFGSKWVGLKHFEYLLKLPNVPQVVANTIIISLAKIFLTLLVSVIMALLINELRSKKFSSITQSVVLFPYYISWVVLGGIISDLLSFNGLFNDLMNLLTGQRYPVMVMPSVFRELLVGTHVWKEMGYNMIILMAAIAGLDQSMYEAADIDGASRFQKIMHVTVPNIMPMVTLLMVLAMGNLMSAGFDQVFVMYSEPVYSVADILDTYIYRLGMKNAQYSVATAVGLFKSVIGFVLVLISYWCADRFAGYKIF